MPPKSNKRRGHGEGFFRQTSSGKWEGATWVAEVGKRVYATGETEKKARELLNDKVIKIRSGALSARAEAILFGDYAQRVIRERPGLGPNSRYRYLINLHTYLKDLIPIRVDRITPAILRSLYADMRERGLAENTRLHTHGLVRLILETAKADGLVARNVADTPSVRPKRARGVEQKLKYYNQTQARWIIQAAQQSPHLAHGHLVAFLLLTGLRLGEALALRWKNTDLEKATLNVIVTRTTLTTTKIEQEGPPKTAASRREIPLSFEALAVLKMTQALNSERHKALYPTQPESEYVFCSLQGKPLYPTTARATFQGVLKRADELAKAEAERLGKPHDPIPMLSNHALRHTYVSLAATSGVRLEIIARLIGDKPETMIATYLHVFEENLTSPSLDIGGVQQP